LEISYLTVGCDFQEVPAQLPRRIRTRSEDKGFYFVTEQKEPIQGPKTLEEADEEVKMKQGMVEYLEFRAAHQMKLKPEQRKRAEKKEWTPRWADMPIKEADQIPVRVTFFTDENCYDYDWILRRDFEWIDFRFLVNSKLGHTRWEAEISGNICNGLDTVFLPNQQIRVVPLQSKKACKKFEKHLKGKQEAWDRVSATFQGYDNWHSDEVPTEYGDTEPVSNEEDYTIAVEFPGEEEIKLMRIPKGNEWAFFETFVTVKLGENERIAGFDDGLCGVPWDANDRVPRPGQRVRIFWVKERVKAEKEVIREEKIKEVTHVIFSRPKPTQAHPVRAGGKVVPMESFHKKVQQPLSLKSEQQRRKVQEELKQRTERPKKAK
jgi:hypothetical protein